MSKDVAVRLRSEVDAEIRLRVGCGEDPVWQGLFFDLRDVYFFTDSGLAHVFAPC